MRVLRLDSYSPHDTHIGVADTRMCQVDQDFSNAWLWGIDLFQLGGDGSRVVIYQGLVPRRYLYSCHDV